MEQPIAEVFGMPLICGTTLSCPVPRIGRPRRPTQTARPGDCRASSLCYRLARGSAGGGTPPKTLQEVDWVPGAGSQTFAASVNDLVIIVGRFVVYVLAGSGSGLSETVTGISGDFFINNIKYVQDGQQLWVTIEAGPAARYAGVLA